MERTCMHVTRETPARAEGKGKGKGREQEGNGTESTPATGHTPQAVESSAHAEFIRLWTDEFPKFHDGTGYAFQGAKDGNAVKLLLQSSKLSPSDLLGVAVAAWRNPAGFYCKGAAALASFNSGFNNIREELRTKNGNRSTGIRENIKPHIE